MGDITLLGILWRQTNIELASDEHRKLDLWRQTNIELASDEHRKSSYEQAKELLWMAGTKACGEENIERSYQPVAPSR